MLLSAIKIGSVFKDYRSCRFPWRLGVWPEIEQSGDQRAFQVNRFLANHLARCPHNIRGPRTRRQPSASSRERSQWIVSWSFPTLTAAQPVVLVLMRSPRKNQYPLGELPGMQAKGKSAAPSTPAQIAMSRQFNSRDFPSTAAYVCGSRVAIRNPIDRCTPWPLPGSHHARPRDTT